MTTRGGYQWESWPGEASHGSIGYGEAGGSSWAGEASHGSLGYGEASGSSWADNLLVVIHVLTDVFMKLYPTHLQIKV